MNMLLFRLYLYLLFEQRQINILTLFLSCLYLAKFAQRFPIRNMMVTDPSALFLPHKVSHFFEKKYLHDRIGKKVHRRKLNRKLFKLVFIKRKKTNRAPVKNESTYKNPFRWQLEESSFYGKTFLPFFLKTVIIYLKTQMIEIGKDRFWLNAQRMNSWKINCSAPLSVALKALCFSCTNLKNVWVYREKRMMVFHCHTKRLGQCFF